MDQFDDVPQTLLICSPMDFLTGFSDCQGSPPGSSRTTKGFRVEFREVLCNSTKNCVSQGLECCYDWGPVMVLLLEAAEGPGQAGQVEQVEERAERGVVAWLATLPGWGLLASCLEQATQQLLLGGMEGVRRRRGCSVREAYMERSQEYQGFGQLVPEVSVSMDEEVEGDDLRRKSLTLTIHGARRLDICFSLSKLRVVDSLVEAAAEVVGRRLVSLAGVVELGVPREHICNVSVPLYYII